MKINNPYFKLIKKKLNNIKIKLNNFLKKNFIFLKTKQKNNSGIILIINQHIHDIVNIKCHYF